MKKYRFLSFITAVFMMFPLVSSAYAMSEQYDAFLAGDVNEDGTVNAMDIECLKSYFVGLSENSFCIKNADVNRNNKIEAIDLVLTIMIILGTDNENNQEQSDPDNVIKSVSDIVSDIIDPDVISDMHEKNINDENDLSQEDSSSQDTDIVSGENVSSETENEADAVFRLINEIRISDGIEPFEKNEQLDALAMKRTEEISQKFSHNRPDGSSCFDLLDEYNIDFCAAGENIASGSTTAQGVVDQWMNSKGHRDNIMNPNYKYLGIGYYKSENGTCFWAQLFIG